MYTKRLPITDGGTWQKAKIPPSKQAIASNGVDEVGLPSEIACGEGFGKLSRYSIMSLWQLGEWNY